MKLKNKTHQKLLLSYVDSVSKKTIRVMPHEEFEIEDSAYFLSKKIFDTDKIEILEESEILIPVLEDKMMKAKREIEEYIKLK